MGLYANQVKDSQQVQDNLNPQQSVIPILKRTTENIVNEEGPTVILKRDISTDTLWDLFNWDESNWDETYDNALVDFAVSNPNNDFYWDFTHTKTDNRATGGNITWGFTNTGNSTATEDTTTNYRVDFTSGQVWESSAIWKDGNDNKTVTTVTLVSATSSGTLSYSISTNGTAFTSISIGETITLPNNDTYRYDFGKYDVMTYDEIGPDNALYIRAEEVSGSSAYLDNIRVQYTTN